MATESRGLSKTSSRALLGRILEEPDLPAQIERLPPPLLGKLIDRIGLEDAGELLSFTSTAQLAQVFDDDLWKNERPGEAERFDAERFLLWLEVMLEAGDAFVAKKLVELPEDLVTLALHRHVLVIDIDALGAEVSADDGEVDWQLEKALESTLHEELGEYRLIARRHDGWDTLFAAVLALDREDHDHLWRILERCCAMSSEHIEESGGLYEVLTSEEMLEADVAGEREDRRSESGYVSPTTASSFLKLARTDDGAAADTRDPVTRAYFRGLAPTPVVQPRRGAHAGGAPKSPELSRSANGGPESGGGESERGESERGESGVVSSLYRVLAEAGLTEEPQVGRLLSGGASAEEPLIVRAMRVLGDSNPRLFGERSEELAYLANVLVSGASFRGRRFRPIEALRAVMATCSLGLSIRMPRSASGTASPRWPVGAPPTEETVREAATCLEGVTADGLFRLAHHHLHREVVRRARATAERFPSGLEAPLADALRALQEDCPSLAGALVRAPARAVTDPESDETARFIGTPTELAAALHFLASLDGSAPEQAESVTPGPAEEEVVARTTVPKETTSPRTTRKKTPTKKTASPRTTRKKTPAKKTPTKKTPARKIPTKKPSVRNAPARKTTRPKKKA